MLWIQSQPKLKTKQKGVITTLELKIPLDGKKRATLVDSFLESVKLTKNSDHDKYRYSRCGIRFNTRSIFSINVELGKNANGFGTNVSTHVYHCILIIGKMIS